MAKFRGKLNFCSNFHSCPVKIWGIEFPTSEHAFMAGKVLDDKTRDQIASFKTASEAKKFGRTVALRKDWEVVKSSIMLQVLLAKFSQNPVLLAKLKEVPDEDLIEINEWGDKFWGVCNGEGKNILGRLLQVVKYSL